MLLSADVLWVVLGKGHSRSNNQGETYCGVRYDHDRLLHLNWRQTAQNNMLRNFSQRRQQSKDRLSSDRVVVQQQMRRKPPDFFVYRRDLGEVERVIFGPSSQVKKPRESPSFGCELEGAFGLCFAHPRMRNGGVVAQARSKRQGRLMPYFSRREFSSGRSR